MCVYAGLPTDCRFFKEGSHQSLGHKKASHRSHTDPCLTHYHTTRTNHVIHTKNTQKHQDFTCSHQGLWRRTLTQSTNRGHFVLRLWTGQTLNMRPATLQHVSHCWHFLVLVGPCWSLLAAFWSIGNTELAAQHVSERNHSDWGCSAQQISA